MVQKVNPYLKRLFYVFNGLLGITGCLWFIASCTVAIMGAVGSTWEQYSQVDNKITYVMAVAFVLLSFLGIFGAHKEYAFVLGVYLVKMMVGAIVLFIRGIQVCQISSLAWQVVESTYQNRSDWEIMKPTYMKNINDFFRPALGMAFGCSAASILGVILCVCILHQIGPCRPSAAIPYVNM